MIVVSTSKFEHNDTSKMFYKYSMPSFYVFIRQGRQLVGHAAQPIGNHLFSVVYYLWDPPYPFDIFSIVREIR